MVLGLAAIGGLKIASIPLAALTGGAFGYAYGYNVRRGYHDFKPSKSKTTSNLLQSLNPVEQNTGAGQLAAEQRTGVPVGSEPATGVSINGNETGSDRIENVDASRTITREQKNQMSRAEFKRWYHNSKYQPRNLR